MLVYRTGSPSHCVLFTLGPRVSTECSGRVTWDCGVLSLWTQNRNSKSYTEIYCKLYGQIFMCMIRHLSKCDTPKPASSAGARGKSLPLRLHPPQTMQAFTGRLHLSVCCSSSLRTCEVKKYNPRSIADPVCVIKILCFLATGTLLDHLYLP